MTSELFDIGAESLERRSSLDRLQARGTLRIAIKNAGVNLETLSLRELEVVLEKVLPHELESVGIENGKEICSALRQDLNRDGAASAEGEPTPSIQDVFDRLGQNA